MSDMTSLLVTPAGTVRSARYSYGQWSDKCRGTAGVCPLCVSTASENSQLTIWSVSKRLIVSAVWQWVSLTHLADDQETCGGDAIAGCPQGHEGYPKAEVTGGGVPLEQVDCKTMESRVSHCLGVS